MRLYRYFTFWALAYIAACPLARARTRGRVRCFFDPAAVALFLFFGNLALLALSALVWRRPFDASFFVASAALHSLGLAALPWVRIDSSVCFACACGWAASLRNLALLWFAYLAAVGGPVRVRDLYRRMPTRWADLSLLS